jgi:hypothetical protein
MIMTIAQVLTIWISHQAAGISTLSWSAYLISAVVWLWYGLQKRDKNIYRHASAGSCSTVPYSLGRWPLNQQQIGEGPPGGTAQEDLCPQKVLELRGRGHSYRQIARQLGIGEGTVRRLLRAQ